MLQDLIQHKWFTDASLLKAVQQHDKAAQDEELRRLLHHVILANRFWIRLSCGRPFALEEESRIPESLEAIMDRYRETQAEELAGVFQFSDAELGRTLESTFIPGGRCTVAEGLMQVCMHSHGHRSQCATRLRRLGGTPPTLDFILWLKERPAAVWP